MTRMELDTAEQLPELTSDEQIILVACGPSFGASGHRGDRDF